MAFDFNQTRNEVIEAALRIVGVNGEGETLSGEQYTNAAQALNRVIKEWSLLGTPLWTYESVNVSLVLSDSVTLSGKTYYCILSHLASATNAPNTAAGQAYWREGSNASTPAAWVSGTSYVSSNCISVDSSIFAVENVYLLRNSVRERLRYLTHAVYLEQANLYTLTDPDSCAFDKANSRIILAPVPNDVKLALNYTTVRLLATMVNATDNPDILSTWMNALVYALAAHLADEYQLELQERRHLVNLAQQKYQIAKGGQPHMTNSPFVRNCYGGDLNVWQEPYVRR